jgi:hypothetical protein
MPVKFPRSRDHGLQCVMSSVKFYQELYKIRLNTLFLKPLRVVGLSIFLPTYRIPSPQWPVSFRDSFDILFLSLHSVCAVVGSSGSLQFSY